MDGRIDYQIEKYQFAMADESARLTRQWTEVMDECCQLKAGAEERLRAALLNADYVTSFELPFRFQLIRAPQLIDLVRKDLPLSRKPVTIGDSRYSCVYSLKTDLSHIPDEFRYRFSNRIRRVAVDGITTAPYQEIAKQVKRQRNDYGWRWKPVWRSPRLMDYSGLVCSGSWQRTQR